MLKVGLTGGIACGKTAVAELFAARGCRVLFADLIAHEQITPGKPAYNEIVAVFGKEILSPAGTIDRHRLGEIVFADRGQLERLSRIVHPYVIAETEREMARVEKADADAVVVVEAALLIETEYYKKLDKLIVVWCRPEQQIERLVTRDGLTREAAEQRLHSQMSAQEKRQFADFEVDCSGRQEKTEEQVERIYSALRQLAGESSPP